MITDIDETNEVTTGERNITSTKIATTNQVSEEPELTTQKTGTTNTIPEAPSNISKEIYQ